MKNISHNINPSNNPLSNVLSEISAKVIGVLKYNNNLREKNY